MVGRDEAVRKGVPLMAEPLSRPTRCACCSGGQPRPSASERSFVHQRIVDALSLVRAAPASASSMRGRPLHHWPTLRGSKASCRERHYPQIPASKPQYGRIDPIIDRDEANERGGHASGYSGRRSSQPRCPEPRDWWPGCSGFSAARGAVAK